MARGRVVKQVLLGVGAVLVVAGGYAAFNWSSLSAHYAAYRFRTADDRGPWAAKLLALGEVQPLTEPFRTDDAAACESVVAAVRTHLGESSGDSICSRAFLDGFPTFTQTGQFAALELVPDLLKSSDAETRTRCRVAIQAGLAGPPEVKARAVRLALRPEVGLRAEVAALRGDASAPVRRAAMLVAGLGEGPALVGDDALFRFLHDPDAEVRDLCEAALAARGFDDEAIQLARLLADPHPTERLALAHALERPTVAQGKPGPWLERLAHDPEPAVRAAAARVAAERAVPNAAWLHRMADADPDPTVRRLAGYYRAMTTVRPAGFNFDR